MCSITFVVFTNYKSVQNLLVLMCLLLTLADSVDVSCVFFVHQNIKKAVLFTMFSMIKVICLILSDKPLACIALPYP